MQQLPEDLYNEVPGDGQCFAVLLEITFFNNSESLPYRTCLLTRGLGKRLKTEVWSASIPVILGIF